MLAKRHRLDRTEFKKAFSLGRIGHTPYFTIRTSASEQPRVACVVSKKVAPLAVDRNKIKRRFMMAASPLLKKGLIKKGAFIFFPKKGVSAVSFSVLESEIKKALV